MNGSEWSMFSMAVAICDRTLCEASLEEMGLGALAKSIFDVLASWRAEDRIVGERYENLKFCSNMVIRALQNKDLAQHVECCAH